MRKKGIQWWNVLVIKKQVFSHIHAKNRRIVPVGENASPFHTIVMDHMEIGIHTPSQNNVPI